MTACFFGVSHGFTPNRHPLFPERKVWEHVLCGGAGVYFAAWVVVGRKGEECREIEKEDGMECEYTNVSRREGDVSKVGRGTN